MTTTDSQAVPRTEAGKRLVAAMFDPARFRRRSQGWNAAALSQAIRLVEAEAASLVPAPLDLVLRVPTALLRCDWPPNDGLQPGDARFDAVLASVRERGIAHPLTIREDWKVIDGEHRLHAARLLRLRWVPVVVWTGSEWLPAAPTVCHEINCDHLRPAASPPTADGWQPAPNREVPPPPVGPPAPIPPGFGSPQQLPPANLSLMGTVTKGRAVQPDPLTGDVAANFQTSADAWAGYQRSPATHRVGNPLGKFIKGEIGGDEYVRQTNEKRKRHGLPPLVAATPDGHPDWPHPPWGDDEDKAEGLLMILRQNARYTDGHTRNVRAIVGFIAGLRAATPDASALRTALQRIEALPRAPMGRPGKVTEWVRLREVRAALASGDTEPGGTA